MSTGYLAIINLPPSSARTQVQALLAPATTLVVIPHLKQEVLLLTQ